MRLAIILAYICILFAVSTSSSLADDFPSKPLKIVVPYGAGSTADVRVRQLAKPLGDRLGVAVIVENKPGASATIGNAAAAQAKPDGYTLLYVNNASLCITPLLVRELTYDAQHAFAPITQIAFGAAVIVVPRASPASTLKEFIAAAKAQPGKLTYGTSGLGSTQHIPTAWLAQQTGIDILHIPYKSDSDTLLDLANGRIDLSIPAFTGAIAHIKAGKLKALAVTSRKRVPLFPDIPTMAEAGYPQFEWHNWYGFVAPAATPNAVIERLRKEFTALFEDAALRNEYANAGYELVNGSPTEFAALIKSEQQRYGELIRAIGLKPQ